MNRYLLFCTALINCSFANCFAVSAQNVAETTKYDPKSYVLPVALSKFEHAKTPINAWRNFEVAQTPNAPTNQSPNVDSGLLPTLQISKTAPRTYSPSLTAGGVPSAFGLRTGDFFAGLFGSTAGKSRDTVDGSIAIGTGLGDPDKYLALEGVFNMNSIRNFGSNGAFDLKIHRTIYQGDNGEQLAAAVGWNTFATYGSNASTQPSSVYGALSWFQPLNPDNKNNPMNFSVTGGVGGGIYRFDPNASGVGAFGSVGLQVSPNIGVSTGWVGKGLNLSVSYLPVTTQPLYLTISYSDVGNATSSGSQLILGLSYGFNFLPR